MGDIVRIPKEKFSVLTLTGEIGTDCADLITTLFNTIVEEQKDIVIALDFKNVTSFDLSILRNFLLSFKNGKDQGVHVHSFNVSDKIARTFIDNGVESSFDIIDNLPAKLKEYGIEIKRIQLDVAFLNPFIKATIQTFGVQANIAIDVGKIVKKTQLDDIDISLAGVIGITSDRFTGSMAICFPKETFLYIYNSMLFTEEKEISKDMQDAAGEFTNIILGMAKAEINSIDGYTIEKAIPSIIFGDNITVSHHPPDSSLIVPFSTPGGNFYLDIGLQS